MTLYELLTGIHPYSDREPLMMRIFKLDNQTPDLDPVQKNTPEALIKVMTDSWSYEASDRPDFKEITDRVKILGIEPTYASLGLYFGEKLQIG
ncbi:uncharacterized protein LOC115918263 isoform X2 [Strongylocentrotus purpuratus]|uniref:Serine-threonine/tyrosine-protein kinase catalytic domain-containing protein n=1 Tax=Strongylocentrotus purpuratus TaxID=7668 RepID=A0A7M7P1N8_STRPU|nr:uncharacterized protein LOC115918263 isoform X2 [Strongylocentrotus purpuratus]